MFAAYLKNGDVEKFNGECNQIDYCNDHYCRFYRQYNDRTRLKLLGCIPHDNILKILNEQGDE